MEYGGTSTVTRQGQVTVPKNIRDTLGLDLGSILEFYFTDDLVVIKKRRPPIEVFEELASETRVRFKKKKITKADIAKEIRKHRKGAQ